MGDNTFLSLKQHWLKSMPFRIALLYFLIASLYIFFSDRLLVIITPSMESYQKAQTYKGWGFVATTTFLLYLVLNSEHRQLLRINERLEEEGEKLKTTIGQLEEAFREVRALALRCSKIEEIERRRLADELHDRVGQTLTAMNLNLKILHGLLPRESPQPVFERLQDVQSLIA
ncbi:MAG: histidine kinase, partial [Anaerolineales bacterium]|nr:histidine kinase [Anaerolineales bacterium]